MNVIQHRNIRHHEQSWPDAGVRSVLPLLLLAGTACDARLFAPLLARLDHPDAHVIEIEGADTTPDVARMILAEAPPRFALFGFSLGGIVALEMIAQAPERVERLCLINTTARPDPAANAITRRQAVAKARAAGMEGFILDSWSKLVAPANIANQALRDIICAMARSAGADVLACQSEVAIHRADSRPRLGTINIPMMVLAGAHEQVCTIEAQREIADGVAGALYQTIEDAGHFALLENPEAVATHVTRWLGLSSFKVYPNSHISHAAKD